MEIIEEFWNIYDKYIQTEDKVLRKELSDLLAQVEEKGREKQLFRPEKGWNRILAWQVLQTKRFIYPRVNQPVLLYEGEILAWTPCWDRDVYLTRIPYHEEVSGYIIRPGYYLECDQKDMTDSEWNEFANNHIFSDERGLYLSLYEFETVKKLAFEQIDLAKEKVVSYLSEKISNPSFNKFSIGRNSGLGILFHFTHFIFPLLQNSLMIEIIIFIKIRIFFE